MFDYYYPDNRRTNYNIFTKIKKQTKLNKIAKVTKNTPNITIY